MRNCVHVVAWLLIGCGGCYLSHELEGDGGPPVVEDAEAQWFVYRRRGVTVGGEYEFYAVRLGDLTVLSLGRSASDEAFAWSPTIAGRFARIRSPLAGAGSRVEIGQLRPGRVETLDDFPGEAPDGFRGLDWSDDGRFLLHSQGPRTASIYAIEDGARRAVGARWPEWVPERPWLTWPGRTGTPRGAEDVFFLARAEEDFESVVLPSPHPGNPFEPTWAPGTGWWAVVAEEPGTGRRQLWVASGPGTDPRRLPELDGRVSFDLRWSPSGRHLWVGTPGSEGGALFRVDGTALASIEAPTGTVGGWVRGDRLIVERADGVHLVEPNAAGSSEVRVHDEPCAATPNESGPLRLVLTCFDSTRHRHFVWTEGSGTVAVPQLDTESGEHGYPELIWSPNAQRALLMDGRTLRELRTLDGELRVVSEPVSWAEWSRDSSAYVYSTNPGGVAIVDVETGEEVEIEAPDDEYLVKSEGFQRVRD